MSNNIDVINSSEWIDKAFAKNFIKYYEYNHFSNIQQVSSDSSCKVYRANWKDSHNHLTLKSFFNFNSVTVNEIINEFKFQCQVKSHENITRFYGVTTDNSKKYLLVMEYANNGTLRNYMKEHFINLTWNDKLNLALQLARAVSYLHDEGILHHDLHSKNVLVHQGIIKLADFGLLKRIEKSFNQLELFDMVAYFDPKILEQKRNNNNLIHSYTLNKLSNIYSIGVLLWEISSGQPPFCNEPSDTSNIGLDLRILRGLREKPVANTPVDYVKIYIDCWNNEPDNRPIINEVIVRLQSIVSNQLSNFGQPLNNSSHGELSQIIQNFNKINIKEIGPPISLIDNDFSILVDKIIILATTLDLKDSVKQEIFNCFYNHDVTSQKIYNWLLNNQNNSNSIVLLGIFTLFGIEVNVNEKKAFELYQKAANLGDVYGITWLGYCYEGGIGIDVDKTKAFELHQKIANLGDTIGILNVGVCYYFGIGTSIDKQMAYEYYKNAANLGSSIAQYNLGVVYEIGDGVVKDIDQAIHWYKKSAEQGDKYSQDKLAKFFKN
ncbi:unnamed protein product [Rhizophagus irregularis]|nr:unnamed protein product [Rhizophagus irregularis]